MNHILDVDDIRVSIVDNNDYGSIPLLSSDEERDLFQLLNSDDCGVRKRAYDKIFYSNLRLVRSIASQYASFGRIGFEDLYMEGCIGLSEAINRYNVFSDNRFSTYAVNWIKRYISFCIMNQSNNVRIPVYFYHKIKKYIYAKKRFNNSFGNKSFYDYLMDNNILSQSDIILVEKCLNDTVSLDSPVGVDSVSALGEIVIDNNRFEDDIDNSFLPGVIESIINDIDMSSRDKDIVCYSFGLLGYPIKSYYELGSLYNLSYQRIRQIVLIFIDKVKNSESYMKRLKGY